MIHCGATPVLVVLCSSNNSKRVATLSSVLTSQQAAAVPGVCSQQVVPVRPEDEDDRPL